VYANFDMIMGRFAKKSFSPAAYRMRHALDEDHACAMLWMKTAVPVPGATRRSNICVAHL